MSIFTKIGGAILRPIIKMEVKKLMKDLIQPILDFIKDVLQFQGGTKFLVTIGGLGSIVFLHFKGFSTVSSDVVAGVMVIAYYYADIVYKTKIKNGGLE